jgi:23S rRNA pseudouridine1911/1915/1917 synthase
MTRAIRLVVAEDSLPDRLDHYLGTNAPELSRTRAKETILSGLVTVNGAVVKPSAQLAAGDVIEADLPELAKLKARPESIPLTVCHEDDDIIVIDKPAGMVVHPAPGSATGTLVNALLGRESLLSAVGGDLRPGIVHRLDRDTSGLVVVAKNDAAHRRLADAFQARSVAKVYLALVWGRLKEAEGRIEAPIGRRRSDRKKMAVVRDGREAATVWRLREDSPFASLLEIRPETGRTHQIRVHLAHIHRPVVGDDAYGGVRRSFADVPPHYRRQAERFSKAATRQALHARGLAFEHPRTGERLSFVSPLPEDMGGLLSLMRFPDGEVGRVIGIDPGEARIGVAVSDEGRTLASSRETLEGLADAAAAARIGEIAGEADARTVVLGYPIRMDGSIGPRAVRARELAVALEDGVRARVVLWDERLSSAEAERVLRETGERTRRRKGRVDQIAASVILQGYLDAERSRAKLKPAGAGGA